MIKSLPKINAPKMNPLKINPLYLALGKSAVYFTESLPLLLLSQLYINDGQQPPPSKEELLILLKEIYELHKWDQHNIDRGLYPASVISLGSPLRHTLSLAKVWNDSAKVARRMKGKMHKDFSPEAQQYLTDVPEYYSRNFHFQTDGYLSESSARIYNHQVEILFKGTAQTMRRLALVPLRRSFENNEEVEILDAACGPGSLTRDLALTFPNAHITAVDLSFPYLKEAQRALRRFPRVNFLQANVETLPFKDQQFDAITCSFLFHELPHATRQKVLAEFWRVLKPGGVLAVVDSLQLGDSSKLEWALQDFPLHYHEPFYKNYLNHPLEQELQKLTTFPVTTELGFFSKCVSVKRESLNESTN